MLAKGCSIGAKVIRILYVEGRRMYVVAYLVASWAWDLMLSTTKTCMAAAAAATTTTIDKKVLNADAYLVQLLAIVCLCSVSEHGSNVFVLHDSLS